MNIVSNKSGRAENKAVIKVLSPSIIFILLRGRRARSSRKILKILKEANLILEDENSTR